MDQLEQSQLQVETLFLAVIQIVEGAQHNLQVARKFLFAEKQRGTRRARPLVRGDLEQLRLLAAQFSHERIAQVAHHLPR